MVASKLQSGSAPPALTPTQSRLCISLSENFKPDCAWVLLLF